MRLTIIFTAIVIVTSMRFTRCLGGFMSLKEAKISLLSNEKEDMLDKDNHFLPWKYEEQWRAIDSSSNIFGQGEGLSFYGYGISTSTYTFSSDFIVELDNGITTNGLLWNDKYKFYVIHNDKEFPSEYDNGYKKNTEMEQEFGISTEQVVAEIENARETYFRTLNEVAKNEWIRIKNKAIRNVAICAVLWLLTIIQYIYIYRKNKAAR